MKNKLFFSFILLIIALSLKFLSDFVLSGRLNFYETLASILITFILGIWVLRGTADIIEETTEVLSEKTGIAGGVLQAFGTAFPDMVLGVVAALVSLSIRATDLVGAINYAIIAASTTFGSNIYNIGFSAWCVFRQNMANESGANKKIFPFSKSSATPISEHSQKPSHREMDTAISIITTLSVLTSIVAISMVVFGQVKNVPVGIPGDLYQLIRPVGIFVLIIGIGMVFIFRKSERQAESKREAIEMQGFFHQHSIWVIWISLIIAGVAILYSAEAMIHALKLFSDITRVPFVLTGVGAGIIGSLGEMIVVYKFTVNPKGRIGDAIVGVAMDNIVTTIGAAIVAIMGGIFLGGNALILIFVIILSLNSILVWQISKTKDYLGHA